MEKVNITIEFCISELVQVPKFSIHWQFWFFFWLNLPKKGVSSRNGKVALVRVSMVVTYYIKLFRTGATNLLFFVLIATICLPQLNLTKKGTVQKFKEVSWHFTLFSMFTSNVLHIEVAQNGLIAKLEGRATL